MTRGYLRVQLPACALRGSVCFGVARNFGGQGLEILLCVFIIQRKLNGKDRTRCLFL